MEDLQHKYRKGRLSPEELSSLREKVNRSTDDELTDGLRDAWMNEEIDVSRVSSAQMDRMKKRIDRKMKAEAPSYLLIRKILQLAAAVLLPVFVLTTFHFRKENNRLASSEIIIATAAGERVSVTLPDATTVSLNAESTLSYMPQTYCRDRRQIVFEGEGYFQVAQDAGKPFEIKAKGLNVQVSGTVFNLLVRENREEAVLALEEGSVSFASTLTGKRVLLSPFQKAILNQSNGEIRVLTDRAIKDASSWKRNELTFRNVSFPALLRSVEENYGIRIETDYQADPSDLFTGTIPASDINEALEIIERTWHLKAYMQGKDVRLMNEKIFRQ
jgi:ferric-dicitrate binding protein FerR (iron transport regulator)